MSPERLQVIYDYLMSKSMPILSCPMIADLCRLCEEVQQLRTGWRVHALCDKHVHIGHFPPDVPPLNNPLVQTVCPWCERKGAR